MILLQLHQIARLFGADVLFENVNLEIKSNSRIALVGPNGVGKSTLLKIIAGVEEPSKGEIIKKNNLSLSYLAQDTGLNSEKTIFNEMLSVFNNLIKIEQRMKELEQQMATHHDNEKIFKEYDELQYTFSKQNGYGYEAEIRSLLHGFKFDESFYDKKVSSLSGGQKTRLALAKMLLEKPDLLILDEPTNHLDIETLNWLEKYLQSYSGALLIVSHDRYFLDKVVNEIYELDKHTSIHYKGNYSYYAKQKQINYELAKKAYDAQQADIKKTKEFIAKNIARSSTTKRAQSRQKQLDKIEVLEKPTNYIASINIEFPIDKNSGNDVLKLNDASIGYDKPLSKHINLDIKKNDAVAIIGPNGIGKSTLLKSIMHIIPFLKGELKLGANVSLGYYDQEQENLNYKKDVLHELWDLHPTTNEKDIRTKLASFLFKGDDVSKPISVLSGGEKARLTLAKLSMEYHNTLILDEPTNHLDLQSKTMLEDALTNFEGTLCFVSHDRYFINKIANKIIELSPDGSKLYLGNYDYYLEKKQEEIDKLERQENTPSEIKVIEDKKNNLSREEQKKRRQIERKLKDIEEDINLKEEEISNIEQMMLEDKYQQDSQKLTEFHEQITSLQNKLDENLILWEKLTTELEKFDN